MKQTTFIETVYFTVNYCELYSNGTFRTTLY